MLDSSPVSSLGDKDKIPPDTVLDAIVPNEEGGGRFPADSKVDDLGWGLSSALVLPE